jgi:hypothetical protein
MNFKELMKWKNAHTHNYFINKEDTVKLWKFTVNAYRYKEINSEEFGNVVGGTMVCGEIFCTVIDVFQGQIDYITNCCGDLQGWLQLVDRTMSKHLGTKPRS